MKKKKKKKSLEKQKIPHFNKLSRPGDFVCLALGFFTLKNNSKMDPPPSHSSSSSSSAAPSSQGALLSQPSGSSGKEQPLVPLVMREFCDKEQKKNSPKFLTAFSLLVSFQA